MKTLVLIGTPYKVPKAAFGFQKLKVIEDTGHVVNEENPKVLAEILNEYYRQNP